jgi:hypothetical protein
VSLVWLAIILALCGNVVGAAAIGLVLAKRHEDDDKHADGTGGDIG